MDASVKKLESGKAEMELSVTWGEIEKSYKEQLLKYQKGLALPGFRKGKVPLQVMESKFGDDLLQQTAAGEIDKALREAIGKADPEMRPLPYCSPVMQNETEVFPVKKGEDMKLKVTYDIVPDVNIGEYKGLDVEYPNVRISDDMVSAEIERLRERNSIVERKADGSVEKNDIVTVDYVNLDSPDGSEKVNGYTCTVGALQGIYEFDDDILGMKEGETREFVKDMKGKVKPAGITADSVRLKVTVKSIKVKKLPELDDEFAQDVKGEYKTVADLKNGIRADLEKNLDERMKETKISLVIDKILENADIAIPESMLENEIESSYAKIVRQMGATEESFAKYLKDIGQSKESFTSGWRPDATKKLKGQLIISEVRKREDVKAEEDKVQAILKERTPEGAPEAGRKHFEEVVRDNLGFDAAIDFLIAQNNLKPGKKEISYEDYASGKYLEDEKAAEDEAGKSGKDKPEEK